MAGTQSSHSNPLRLHLPGLLHPKAECNQLHSPRLRVPERLYGLVELVIECGLVFRQHIEFLPGYAQHLLGGDG